MNSNTKTFRHINKLNFQIQKKIWVFQNIGVISIFFLFLGFVFGNLFGTFLDFFRNFLNWDGLIITITICLIEFINFLNYSTKKKPKLKKNFKQNKKNWFHNPKPFSSQKVQPLLRFSSLKNQELKNKFIFLKLLNFYKIGLLLGFFIDAFKVGS